MGVSVVSALLSDVLKEALNNMDVIQQRRGRAQDERSCERASRNAHSATQAATWLKRDPVILR